MSEYSFLENIPIDNASVSHEAQLDADIMINPSISEDIDTKPSKEKDTYEQYGLGESCVNNYVHRVSLASATRVFKAAKFEKNAKVNADILWGKSLISIKKRDGLYSILKSQNPPLSDFLFVFHRKDLETIYSSDKLLEGREEIEILKSYYRDTIKETENQRDLHVAFTDQNALLGTESFLDQGTFCIVCGPNFYIPDNHQTKIAQITIKGKVFQKISGLKNITGKKEKYLYHSKGTQVLEETYPIFSPSVDFRIDRCLFDNLTILDMPENRRMTIFSELTEGNNIQWTLKSLSLPSKEEGVLELDEKDEWFLIQDDLPDGGFDFFICRGGKAKENRVIEGAFRPLIKAQKEQKPQQVVPTEPQKVNMPQVEYNETRVITGRTPVTEPTEYKMTILNRGRKPKDEIIQEFVLTHRLIPFLDKKPETQSGEYDIPVGPPSEFLVDNQNAWMDIRLGFKSLDGHTLSEDRLKVIPRPDKSLYLLGESNPMTSKEFAFTTDVLKKIVHIVDQPGIDDISLAGFRCTLDFVNVPKDESTENRFHWCRVSVDPIRSYTFNLFTALIGRGCFRPEGMDLISEGFWDTLREKRYRVSSDEQADVDKMISRYAYMDIMSSRYHGFFVKSIETLFNVSLYVPVYVYDKDNQPKAILQPMKKELLPDHLTKHYSQLSQLEKAQFSDKNNRDELKKLSASFLTSEQGFLKSQTLFQNRNKVQLESGDSVVIGLSQYTYFKRRANEPRNLGD